MPAFLCPYNSMFCLWFFLVTLSIIGASNNLALLRLKVNTSKSVNSVDPRYVSYTLDWPAPPKGRENKKQQPFKIGTVDPSYVSYTLDWWDVHQGCPPYGWSHHANVLRIDLTNPKLQMLTAALGPSILRIGGSLDKVVEYDMPDYGSMCTHPTTRPCLNASRWGALHEFARATNAQIAFGLSYPEVDTLRKEGLWNSSQAKALLEYSVAQNYSRHNTLYGFELGEELTRYKVGTTAFAYYVAAYQKCSSLIKNLWHDDDTTTTTTTTTIARRPRLLGPAPGMSWPQLTTWFPAFLRQTRGALDVATYHSYNQIEPGHLYLNMTIPSGNLSTQSGSGPGDTGWQAKAMKDFVQEINDNNYDNNNEPPLELWLGEFGPHNGGGGPGNISWTFASSFGYLDTLGTLARLNHKVLARQTLVGGKYELLRCTTGGPTHTIKAGCDFEPLPDYWVGLLWHRLMGTTVLEQPMTITTRHGRSVADTSRQDATKQHPQSLYDDDETGKEPFRLHAHCTSGAKNGSITLAFSNMSPNTTFLLDLSQANLGNQRVEYIVSGHPSSAGFDAEILQLNYDSILHVGNATKLPSLQGRAFTNTDPHHRHVIMAPITLGFVTLPEAKAMACMDDDIGTFSAEAQE